MAAFRRAANFTAVSLVVPTKYSVPVVPVAVTGSKPVPSSAKLTPLFVALLASLRTTIRCRLELARPRRFVRLIRGGSWRLDSTRNDGSRIERDDDADLQELMTVEEVAALLRVSKSWALMPVF